MDKKSLLISFVLIIVIATIAFNFENFTGQAGRLWVLEESLTEQPKGEGSVSVEPKMIAVGEKIYITIEPGDVCIDDEITIYKKGKKLPVIRFSKPSNYKGSSTGVTKYCKEAMIQYKTWSNWKTGDYYVEVKELPKKMTGKIEARTTYYTDDFKIVSATSYPKIIISKIGSFFRNPRIIFGQRYIFRN